MREWFAPAELAGAPGMPSTDRGVRKAATTQGWRGRQRAAVGGGREYHISALPPETRVYLATRGLTPSESPEAAAATSVVRRHALAEQVTETAQRRGRQRALAGSLALPATARRRADAREAIVDAWRTWHATSGLPVVESQCTFAGLFNAGEIPVEDWVRETVRSVSRASLQRWHQRLASEGHHALAGRYGARAGTGAIDRDAELRAVILAMLTDHPHASVKLIHRALSARFSEARLPSRRSIERWVHRWRAENAQLHLAVSHPDAWRHRYQSASGSASEHIERLNQVWELDSTPGDVLLADGHRHSIIGCIDVYSRRLKLLVSRTSKATAIAALVRRALIDWGCPEVAKTDNGQDYVSLHLKRVFRALEIDHQLCPPFSPEKKPHIERAFGTFCRDLVELLAGYIGHSVAERQAIENRKSFADRLMKRDHEPLEVRLSPEDFQRFCDQWCDAVYAREPHGGLDGRTPFDVATAWTGEVRRVEEPRALDVLLSESGTRVVGKEGIRYEGVWYGAPELGGHEGRTVQLLLDEADIGTVYVFTEGGQFMCIAHSPEVSGLSRAELAARRRAHQRQVIAEGKKHLREAARTANVKDIASEILASRVAAASKVTALPRPGVSHVTQALEEAGRALIARAQAEAGSQSSRPLTESERATHAALVAESEAEVVALPDDPMSVHRRWMRIEQRIAGGEHVDPQERIQLEVYKRSRQYASMREFFEEFDLSIEEGAG